MQVSAALAQKKRDLLSASKLPVQIYCPTPTGERFHKSNSFVRYVRGSVGSGKSTMCVVDLPRMFMRMPVTVSGVRKAKAVIVRNTNKQLLTTTIPTWLGHFPEATCGRLVKSPYIRQVQRFRGEDGVMNEFEFIFLPLDGIDSVDDLLSFEATCFYFNELKEIQYVHFYTAMGRIGRWPAKRELVCEEDVEIVNSVACIIADSNAPHVRHWTVEALEHGGLEDKIKGTKLYKKWQKIGRPVLDFFLQPSPILKLEDGSYVENPNAENIENLTEGYDYYFKQLAANEAYINVYILNEYGTTFDGMPVHSEYNPSMHRSKDILQPNPAHPLYIGIDLGGTPAAVIGQYIDGQIIILKEIIVDIAIGTRAFCETRLVPELQKPGYASLDFMTAYDLAVGNINDGTARYRPDAFILEECGLNVRPCLTNAKKQRLESVRGCLNRLVDGKPGLIISRDCQYLHDAFSGGYKFKERPESGGRKRFDYEPCKDYYSHGMDATQYMVMLAIGPLGVKLAVEESEPEYMHINGQTIRI